MIKRLLIEAVFATAVVFGVMGLIASIPLNIGALQPLDAAVEDFDMVDLYYSQLKGSEGHFSKNVIIVNIGDAGRAEIAELIEIVSEGQPAAVGIDIFFDGTRGDNSDSLLASALSENPNVVMATFFDGTNGIKASAPEFYNGLTGFANFVGDDPRFSTIREFSPTLDFGDLEVNSLSVQLAKLVQPDKAEAFLKRSKPVEEIKFMGNLDAFLFLEKDQVLNFEVDPDIFEGKVVLIGFMGNTIGDAYNVEDRFFTPLNEKISGRSLPDMNGIVIHANIIEMILTENWVNGMPPRVKVLVSVLITYLHVLLYMFLILKWELYFDALSKILQLVSIIIMVYIVFLAFHHQNFRLDITLGLLGIALAADVLFVYEAIVNTIYKRFGWKSILIEEE